MMPIPDRAPQVHKFRKNGVVHQRFHKSINRAKITFLSRGGGGAMGFPLKHLPASPQCLLKNGRQSPIPRGEINTGIDIQGSMDDATCLITLQAQLPCILDCQTYTTNSTSVKPLQVRCTFRENRRQHPKEGFRACSLEV